MTAVTPSLSFPAPAADAPKPAPAAAAASGGDSGFSFADFLDVINPLQHIPIVSTLYRAITGDTIELAEQLAGDTLYGGVIGFAASVANIAFKEITGKDAGDTVLAFLEGKDGGKDETIAAASMAETVPPERVASGPPRQLIAANVIASAAPATVAPAAIVPAQATALPPVLTDPAAFMAALKNHGVDADLGLRALYAYRKSLSLSATPAAAQP